MNPSISYTSGANPLQEIVHFSALGSAPSLNQYRGFKEDAETTMAKKSDSVTWTQLNTLIFIVTAALGVGFSFLHGDLTDLRTDFSVLNKDVTAIREQTAGIGPRLDNVNQRLEAMLQEMRLRR